MSDTWGRNPYTPYSQQHDQWERDQVRKREEEDRQYRARLDSVSDTFAHTSHAPAVEGGVRWPRRSAPPWFPGVDAWFDRTLSLSTQRSVALLSALLCAGLAAAYAVDRGFSEAEIWGAAALGAVAGLLVLPMLVFAVKVLLFTLVVAGLGVFAWAVYVTLA